MSRFWSIFSLVVYALLLLCAWATIRTGKTEAIQSMFIAMIPLTIVALIAAGSLVRGWS